MEIVESVRYKYNFFDTLDVIDGIGEKNLVRLYSLLKLKYVKDLILYKPNSIKCFDNEVTDATKEGDHLSAIVKIKKISYSSLSKISKKSSVQIACEILNRNFKLVFFNMQIKVLQSMFVVGKKYLIIGVLGKNNSILHPKILCEEKDFSSFAMSEIIRVRYSLGKEIKHSWFVRIMKCVISNLDFHQDWFDDKFLFENNFDSFDKTIMKLHFPKNNHEYVNAINRLQYDELLSYFLKLNFIRNLNDNYSESRRKVLNVINGDLQNILIDNCGFVLMNSQVDIIKLITDEQRSNKVMRRIVQGDVGSGKSIIAFATALNAVEAGFQSVIMVPTCLLAQQHFDYLSSIFSDNNAIKIDLEISILLGSTKRVERQKIFNNVKNGVTKILIGTHVLFNDDIEFKNLGLIVIDEQQRFGVNQRLKLFEKGAMVDILMLTATPIPRSLVQTIYGDIDYSKMIDKPKCRLDVITTLLSYKNIDILIQRIEKNISNDFKVFWVCPLVENSEYFSFIAVEERFNTLKGIFGDSIAMLYGDLSDSQKIETVRRFRNGDITILVSTTVIETGIDIPDANLIVIENAQCFGLSQLHQLRGRVGRSDKQAFCILLYGEDVSKDAIKRLRILENHSSGFEIAQKDLELRGSGDILGSNQSGMPDFIFFDGIITVNTIEKIKKINLHAKKIVIDNNIEKFSLLISLFENCDDNANIIDYICQRFKKMVSI